MISFSLFSCSALSLPRFSLLFSTIFLQYAWLHPALSRVFSFSQYSGELSCSPSRLPSRPCFHELIDGPVMMSRTGMASLTLTILMCFFKMLVIFYFSVDLLRFLPMGSLDGCSDREKEPSIFLTSLYDFATFREAGPYCGQTLAFFRFLLFSISSQPGLSRTRARSWRLPLFPRSAGDLRTRSTGVIFSALRAISICLSLLPVFSRDPLFF